MSVALLESDETAVLRWGVFVSADSCDVKSQYHKRSTKTLRNFIELLQQWVVESPSFFASAAGTTIKQEHSHRSDDQQPLRTLHGKPTHTCGSIHFICFWVFPYYCTVTMTVVV